MGVVALPNLSPQVTGGPAVEWEQTQFNQSFASPFGSFVQTWGNGAQAAQKRARLKFENVYGTSRARLEAWLQSMRGQAQRTYLPDFSYIQRGSMTAPELYSNNTFDSTSGWTVNNDYVATVADNVMRLTRVEMGGAVYPLVQSVTPTQYAPHVIRLMRQTRRGSFSAQQLTDAAESTDMGSGAVISADGLLTFAYVPIVAGARNVGLYDGATFGQSHGDFFEVPYISYSRCAMVDNGPNAILRSDQFDNAAWTKTALAAPVANSNIAPDGTTTAENIVETTANSTHELQQAFATATAAQDLCFCVAIAPGSRSWVHLVLTEATGSTSGGAYFNVTTGAVGSLVNGANMSSTRAFIVDVGLTYKYCCIVVRKSNAATSVTARIMLATADGGAGAYVGTAAVTAIVVWRATLARSSLPVRLTAITDTINAVGTAQTGSRLYLKGLPASTNGLLSINDAVTVITTAGSERKTLTAPLNSDASGRGDLLFESPLRNSPADNAAVIVCRPLMRTMLDSNTVSWRESPGGFADLEFVLAEDLAG